MIARKLVAKKPPFETQEPELPKKTCGPAENEPLSPTVAHHLQAQQTFGNRWAQAIVEERCASEPSAMIIQPRLVIGSAGDNFEQEADQIARRAVRSFRNGRKIQQQLPRKQKASKTQSFCALEPVSPLIKARIERAKSNGHPLPTEFRQQAETALAADFAKVNIHDGLNANMLTYVLRAKAFTTGQHIFFRRGTYDPSSFAGQHLVLHELVHVKQQQRTPYTNAIGTEDTENSRLPEIVQRFPALDELYKDKKDKDQNDLARDPYFPKFKRVRNILRDKAIVDKHLRTLSAYMKRHEETTNTALKGYELGRQTERLPMLTDFVPDEVFVNLVRQGQLFEDLVNPRHGMQTHRLQWFVVSQEQGDNWARDVFRESINPRWRILEANSRRNMWDFIVDEIGAASDTDFTQPSNLEAYITGQAKLGRLSALAKDVRRGHDATRDIKDELRSRYPREDRFTLQMLEIRGEHQKIAAQMEGQGAGVAGPLKNEQVALVKEIQSVKLMDTSYVGGVKKTITWTGWIAREDSQAAANIKEDFPYFVPTVAYLD